MILNDIEIMFGGQAGDGSLTTGDLIAGTFKRMGLEVYTYKDFPSRIRGGHTNYVIRAGSRQNYGMADFVDGSRRLRRRGRRGPHRRMRPGGFVLFDNSVGSAARAPAPRRRQLVRDPARQDREGRLGLELVRNTISLGVLAKLIGMDPALSSATEVAGVYRRKGDKVVDLNFRAIEAGENVCHRALRRQTERLWLAGTARRRPADHDGQRCDRLRRAGRGLPLHGRLPDHAGDRRPGVDGQVCCRSSAASSSRPKTSWPRSTWSSAPPSRACAR